MGDMTFVDIQSFIDAFCTFHPAVQFTFDIGKKFTFDNEIPGIFRCNRPVCNTCDFVSHVRVVTGA